MPTSRWCRLVTPALAFSVAAGLRIAAVPSEGQAPRAVTAADQPPRPVFRTEANYVRVDVYPTKDGQPVNDLTRDDFEVVEDKTPQRIEQFEQVQIRAAGPQDTRREPNTVRESREALNDPRARVFVIFLDTYHVEVDGSHRIRGPLINAMNAMIGQDDLVGVMTPEMSAADVTFARKTVTIEGLLTRYWPWGERDQINRKDPEEKQYYDCYPGDTPPSCAGSGDRGIAATMIERRHEKRTLDALRDLVRDLRDVREERKAILVVSDGWRLFRPDQNLMRLIACDSPGQPQVTIDPQTGKLSARGARSPLYGATKYACDADRIRLSQIDDEQQFRQMLDEANRANASFYPVDPRGLAVFDEQILPPDPPSVTALAPMVPLEVDQARLTARIGSLRTLAAATDGLALVNSNDLAGGLKRVVSDLTSYYLLGYYSTSTKPDGKFHAITVRVKRPGVQVRARRGYLAPTVAELTARTPAPAAPANIAAAAEAQALATSIAPLEAFARELPMRLQTTAGWKPGNAAAVWAIGELGPSEDRVPGAAADVMLTSAAGATLTTVHVRIEPGTRSFRVVLAPGEPLTPGDYVLRVRLKSASGSSMPSNDAAPFTLRSAPDATDALLVRRGPTTGNKDWPTADRRFRRSETLRVEVPAPDVAAPSARLLDRTSKPLSVPVVSAVRDDADGSRWQTAQLALASLAPGDYIVELTQSGAGGVTDAGDAKGAVGTDHRALAAFRVVP
jgi:VWFA-related protein